MRISQKSQLSHIFFLIYNNGVFDKITKSVMFLFFIDDLGFIAFEYLVKKLVKTLGGVTKIVLE